jgi:peptide/nickel transport system permease protein
MNGTWPQPKTAAGPRKAALPRLNFPPLTWIGIAILSIYVFAALAAPWLAPYDPNDFVSRPYAAPNQEHLLGTNDIGQDILSELIYGARVSLLVGFFAALISLSTAALIGTLAGYLGGMLDAMLMRLVDVLLVIPRLPLIIVIAAYLGTSLETIILVIGFLSWPGPARVIRSQVLSLRGRTQIEAAQLFGGKTGYIIRRHLIPSLAPILAAVFIGLANRAVFMEASMAFLGLGDPSLKSWGLMIRYALDARDFFFSSRWVWWLLPAGLNLTLLLLGFAFIGMGLEAASHPRTRRHI